MENRGRLSWLTYSVLLICFLVGAIVFWSDVMSAQSVFSTSSLPNDEWAAEYYDTRWFVREPVIRARHAKIDFDWGELSSSAALSRDNFGMRWHRQLIIDETATYRFMALGDGVVRVVIDGAELINFTNSMQEEEIELTAGTHLVLVEYGEITGPAFVSVDFERVGEEETLERETVFVEEAVEPKAMSKDQSWQAYYFDNPTLSGDPVLTAMHPMINFDWGTDAPIQQMPADQFSMRWRKTIVLEEAASYRFVVRTDYDIRLLIDGEEVGNAWQRQSDVTLSAGSHDIVVEYVEDDGRAYVFADFQQIDDPDASTYGILFMPKVTDDVSVTYSRENGATVAKAQIPFEDSEGDVITADWGNLHYIKGDSESFVFRDSPIEIDGNKQMNGATYEKTFTCAPNDFETHLSLSVVLHDWAGNQSESRSFEIDCSQS